MYQDYYQYFVREHQAVSHLSGACLEIGSGGGFLKDILPNVLTSDVCPDPGLDRVVHSEKLDFPDESLRAIFLLNVLHHLPDPEAFFNEANRCLVRGGRLVMIEPYRSWWSRVFYRFLHHEPFDDQAPAWTVEGQGRLHRANIAVPWIIFWRDRQRFESLWPALRIRSLERHTVFKYLISGGVSWRALLPGGAYPVVHALDDLLSKCPRVFSIFQTIVIEKQ
ncbi:MAG: class I SAM-dependent methyltransferase [Elusimicrobiota bacterium]